jgi:tryptophan 2,3-dioxygenase
VTTPPPAGPRFDEEGRRTDGRWLLYGEYVNVDALLRLPRVPEDLPKGRTRAEWPAWPEIDAPEGGRRRWRPGDPWPREWPHDEHLFLVTHQAFELWFKQVLHDLDALLLSAVETGERNGARLPGGDDVAAEEFKSLTSASLRLFPKLARAAQSLGEEERRWLLEMPIPGFARSPDRAWSLSWIDAAAMGRWTAWLARAVSILRHATGAFDVLATMTPEAFLEFRGRLVPASGFGSTQFREIEVVSGLGAARAGIAKPREGDPIPGLSSAVAAPSARTPRADAELALARHVAPGDVARLDRRLRGPTLRRLVRALLDAPEVCGADDAGLRERADEAAAANVTALHLDHRREAMHPQPDLGPRMASRWREIGRLLAPPENVGLAWLYRNPRLHPGLVAFLDAAFEWDHALTTWRALHVSFVQRMIGSRPGTGGGGVDYLKKTLEMPKAFPWLWDFRTILMAPVP